MDLLDDLEAALDEDRRQPHRGLVHEHQLRPRHQRPPHRDHLLLSAGERARKLAPALVDDGEQGVHALVVLGVASTMQVCAHLQVLEDRHRAEEAAILGHDGHSPADAMARRSAGDVLACERDSAGARPNDPENRLQRRGLPRRVAP
jgi:hypothetical protein